MPITHRSEPFPLAGTLALAAALLVLVAQSANAWAVWREASRPAVDPDSAFPWQVNRPEPRTAALGTGALILVVGSALTGFPVICATRRGRWDRRLAHAAGAGLVLTCGVWLLLAGIAFRQDPPWDPNDRQFELIVERDRTGG
jgi:Na+/proline symporter